MPATTTINCPGNIVTNITPNCTAVVGYTPTASAGCGTTIRSLTCKPASGSTFKTGATPVTCTAKDSANQLATCSFSVTVLNTATSAIAFNPAPTNYTYQSCSPIAVTFKPAAKVTDTCLASDTKVIVTNYCVPPTKSVFTNGTTTVHCYAQDKSGNSATCSFNITVADTAKPTIKAGVKNECVVQACDGTVFYTTPTSTDTCSGVTILCSPASGSTNFNITGATATTNLVSCSASDSSGNTTNANWPILVNRLVVPVWMAPMTSSDLCFVTDTDAEPTNIIVAGQIFTNQVKLYDLNATDVTAQMSNAVVTIQFSSRNQNTSTSSSLITNITPLVPRLGRGTKGTDLKPVGTMKYIPAGNYFAFDVITTNASWLAGTATNAHYFRTTVTVTPKLLCTKSIVGTGQLRLETAAIMISKAPMPAGLAGSAIGVIGTTIHVVGGCTCTGSTNAHQVYDPTANSWTTAAPAPISQCGAKAEVIDDKLYLLGGCIGGDCQNGTTAALYVYDSATDTWSQKASMLTVRHQVATGVIDGKLFVAGGVSACPVNCTQYATLEVYDPATDAWATLASMPAARDGLAGTAIGGKLYVQAGFDQANLAVVGELYVYDPVLNAWQSKASLPAPRADAAAGTVNGQLYIAGGIDSSNYLASVLIYDPTADAWTSGVNMRTARTALAVDAVNGTIYAIGGANSTSECLTNNEAYTPAP